MRHPRANQTNRLPVSSPTRSHLDQPYDERSSLKQPASARSVASVLVSVV